MPSLSAICVELWMVARRIEEESLVSRIHLGLITPGSLEVGSSADSECMRLRHASCQANPSFLVVRPENASLVSVWQDYLSRPGVLKAIGREAVTVPVLELIQLGDGVLGRAAEHDLLNKTTKLSEGVDKAVVSIDDTMVAPKRLGSRTPPLLFETIAARVEVVGMHGCNASSLHVVLSRRNSLSRCCWAVVSSEEDDASMVVDGLNNVCNAYCPIGHRSLAPGGIQWTKLSRKVLGTCKKILGNAYGRFQE